MRVVVALLYLLGVGLLVAAGFRVRTRTSLALLGAASLALGFTLPAIAVGIHG